MTKDIDTEVALQVADKLDDLGKGTSEYAMPEIISEGADFIRALAQERDEARHDVQSLKDLADRAVHMQNVERFAKRDAESESAVLRSKLAVAEKAIRDAPHRYVECTWLGVDCSCWKADYEALKEASHEIAAESDLALAVKNANHWKAIAGIRLENVQALKEAFEKVISECESEGCLDIMLADHLRGMYDAERKALDHE